MNPRITRFPPSVKLGERMATYPKRTTGLLEVIYGAACVVGLFALMAMVLAICYMLAT